jgi:hypothetical protein
MAARWGHVGYSLPITSTVPTTAPEIEAEIPKARSAIKTLFSGFNQFTAIFVRFCGISPMPIPLWDSLAGSPSTLLSGNLTRFYTIPTEDIFEGAMINLFLSGGRVKARLAKADVAGKECDGFCSTPGGVLTGDSGEFILRRGLVTLPGPIVAGHRYWLSTTVAGGIQTTAPVAAGNVEQLLGMAIDQTSFLLDSNSWIQH